MKTLIKTLSCENGKLYTITGGSRFLLAEGEAKLEIYEHRENVKVLGTVKYSVKTQYSIVLACNDLEFTREVDIKYLQGISAFEFVGDIGRADGIFERVTFNNCIPQELDLTGVEHWKFEIPIDGTMKSILDTLPF
jgi:hypothetical protein